MTNKWLFSFLIGTLAMVVCLVMITITVPLMDEPYQSSMFINGVLGSYGVGSPVAFYLRRQADKLRKANEELVLTQEALTKAHDAMAQKVRIDQMTGFLNREYFFEAYLSHHGPAPSRTGLPKQNTLLIIDADHFKTINDRFGHLAGDAALELITGAITRSVRGHDVIGRIGGEEFGVLLPDTDAREALIVAERIRRNVEELEFVPGGQEGPVRLTVSIGGTMTGSRADLSTAMGVADRNLYAAKDGGRNRVVLDKERPLAA